MSKQESQNIVNQLLVDSKKKITGIFIIQTIFLLIVIAILVILNLFYFEILQNEKLTIMNSSLFGYLGCLIYFSRKSYVYLITGKFLKIIEQHNTKEQYEIITIKSIFRGYYLYLFFRPFVGLIIGPILYMLALTGLITFMSEPLTIKTEISKSGRYLIYIISFLGGHTSSDVLDRFSKIAQKIIIKEEK